MKHINKKLNLGIVGCGRISSKHIGAIYSSSLKNKINIKAICDKKIAKAKIISKKYKINFYENMIKMAQEEDLDMISILTESGNHSKHFLELTKHVKYFVIEKCIIVLSNFNHSLINKYMNPVKEHFLEKAKSTEMLDIVECITRAEDHGLLVEVIYTALKEIKEYSRISPLLALQIALEDWDI